MFVVERIRIQKDIWRALKQAKLPLHPQISAVNKALENVKRVEERLKTFNARHPLLSKILWIIDLLTAYLPLKSKRLKLLKISKRIAVVAKPIVLPPPVEVIAPKPPDLPVIIEPSPEVPIVQPLRSYSDLLESFQMQLYLDEPTDDDKRKSLAFGIELCHFCLACETLFNSLKDLHEQSLKEQLNFEDNAFVKIALETTDQFGKIYVDLLQSINQDQLGSASQQQLYEALKGRWEDVRKSLSAYPKEGLFKKLPKIIRRVAYSISPEVILARSFLEQEIWKMPASREKEFEFLAQIPVRPPEDETFKDHDQLLRSVIETQIQAKNTYLKNLIYLSNGLKLAPEIASWDLCLPSRSEEASRKNYSKYVEQALKAESHRLSFFKFWGLAVRDEISKELKQRFKRFKEAQELIAKR